MTKEFISKLETKNYLIGSFDAYESKSRLLIKNNSNLSEEEIEIIIKSMPTTYRASIINKDGEYIGYIGLFDINAQYNTASIRLETNTQLIEEEKQEIINEFKDYMIKSLNLTQVNELIYQNGQSIELEKQEITPKSNIIIPNNLLIPGISSETLERLSQDYEIPKLHIPFTIKTSDKVIGIIGLSNLIWSNRRANLNIFLDKSIDSDIATELSGYLIDDYINYAHESNIHNITISVNGSNTNIIELLNNTNMNYYGQIPYGAINGDKVESNMMFQHLPNMKKENGIIIPENRQISVSTLSTQKNSLSETIDLHNGFKMVSPKAFEREEIDLNKVLDEHINAMQNREQFTIPLGEDKFILQKGNGNYGISKLFMNYSYIILNEKNDYAGYINILRNNANSKNAEVEIGIAPKLQHRGLGTTVINRFYDELFSIGYASITSSVFEFNNQSIKMHEKVAELNGIRLESYYINGKLWNMNYYSKVNENIDNPVITK